MSGFLLLSLAPDSRKPGPTDVGPGFFVRDRKPSGIRRWSAVAFAGVPRQAAEAEAHQQTH